jgi:hypothetical protein
MCKFKSTNNIFKQTLKRVIYELLLIILLGSFFFSDWSKNISESIELLLMSILIIYTIVGLLLYPRAKVIAENYAINLLENELGFYQGQIKKIPYDDLTIVDIKKKEDQVLMIVLKTKFNQVIKLNDFENMNKLNELLLEKIKLNRNQ